MAPLENVTADELRELLAAVEGKAATQRVMLGLNYAEADVSQAELAKRYGLSEGTVHNWLARLDRLASEPPEEVLYDESPPGKPREITDAEFERFVEVLHDSPRAVGYDAPAWTTALAREYLDSAFEVRYSRRHVRRLLKLAGLSWTAASTVEPDEDGQSADTEEPGRGASTRVWTPD